MLCTATNTSMCISIVHKVMSINNVCVCVCARARVFIYLLILDFDVHVNLMCSGMFVYGWTVQ